VRGVRRGARPRRRDGDEARLDLARQLPEVRHAQFVQKQRARSGAQTGTPYDWTRTYRAGQTMLHPTYGLGEVMALVEPKKIDVLFSDRMRRLVHGRADA